MGKVVFPSEFSEFAFGFNVTHHLVNYRFESFHIGPFEVRVKRKGSGGMISDHEISTLLQEFDDRISKHEADIIASDTSSPNVPTQPREKFFPVDMAMTVRGVYCFLQFKRSIAVLDEDQRLIERHQIKSDYLESDDLIPGDLYLPLYRVYIGGGEVGKNGLNGDREQRCTLEKLERALSPKVGALVRYAAPAFHTLSELSSFHNNGLSVNIEGRWPVVSFRPSAFTIPDNKRHCISFDGKHDVGWRYSSETAKVSDTLSLKDEVDKLAQDAPTLEKSIGPLRKSLDALASEMQLEPRPEKIPDQVLLNMLTIVISSEDESTLPRVLKFMTPPGIEDTPESELAAEIRKIIDVRDGETDRRRMSFLNDFYFADYRCRQILGQPLMVHARD